MGAAYDVACIVLGHLARADVFAGAVVGGVLAAGPILLIPSCGDLPAVVSAELARLDADVVIALGGVTPRRGTFGSPMSSTSASPSLPKAPAWMTS